MRERDPHKALKSEVLAATASGTTKFTLAKLQWGKEDFGFSLHADPRSFSLSGYQVTDFLNQLGFERSVCFGGTQCYVRWVDGSFDLQSFTPLFDRAFNKFSDSQKDLEKCGIFFDQPEGWNYFFGGAARGRSHYSSYYGDGHTASESKLMKESEDDVFHFKFTWLKNDEEDKGWVIHYRLKRFHASEELASVFKFLGMKSSKECPEYEFEPCNWRFIQYVSRGDSPFEGNADIAHAWFDDHKQHFSVGIQKLLEANADIEKAGLKFLPFESSEQRLRIDIQKRISVPKAKRVKSLDETFDVAISFAGTERKYAEDLATRIENAGYSVFYDDFYSEGLWGKDLAVLFDRIYRKQSRYCVMFISREYKDRIWTIHERRSAFARNIEEGGEGYILPIRIDDTDIDGLPPTIGYLSIEKGIDKIAEALISKVGR